MILSPPSSTLFPYTTLFRSELLEILDRLDPSLAELDRAVAKEAEQRPGVRCLMEQPGVGPVTALMFVLTIGPVERFRKSKQIRSEEHTSELQSHSDLVCRLL